MNLKKIFFLLFIFAFEISCKKKDKDVVPNVPVDIYIYTTDPQFFNLQAAGGHEYITGGSRGILVYRVSGNDFVSFDRHCTYQPSNSCGQIEVIQTNISAVDSCCGSQFSIVDGSVQKGPASFPLKQYQTTFDGNVLHIFNQ